ncbi:MULTISPECIES: 7-carboxy-7-deazaguanine synthase QueE [Streptomyces]|uniref:7-carboxy-7-deazaguanine synthase n=2 Tax=Streptomyces TaxID=1883 RepID=A0A124EC51_9ACTN|nr:MULTISPECIES: 7-carboxy-7-deazaguanine synthase QueE [Streptomyces]KUH36518.1 radical SAM protein [Streptomyces kanasensis]UUS34014.1 7-carboxy-7-deazaguanine synthase QueE [Streptomyces changanensis]
MTGTAATAREPLGQLIVAERFGVEVPTFQGEGPSCGHPAIFIRLSRCNLTCESCDTKETWDWSRFKPQEVSTRESVQDLVAWVRPSPVELVVITGGEPLLQQRNLVPLVRRLLDEGRRVEFETNGTVMPAPALLVDGVRFNVSPKLASFGMDEAKSIVPSVLRAFAASGRSVFKFVASSVADIDRIAELVDRHGLAPVWVMPEGTTVEAITSTTRVLADAVASRHWHLTTRLHVAAFADPKGR